MFNLFKTGQNAGQNNESICEKGKKSSKFGHDQTILSSILTVANKACIKKSWKFSEYYDQNQTKTFKSFKILWRKL